MGYRTLFVSREHRYALERDDVAGEAVLSIPVSNRLTDYEEYYRISEEELEGFMADPEAARAFAQSCGRRERDDRLVLKPGSDRGVY